MTAGHGPVGFSSLDSGLNPIPGCVDFRVHWQLGFDAEPKHSAQTGIRAARVHLTIGIRTVIDVAGECRCAPDRTDQPIKPLVWLGVM
jgi:hypothetical protein